MLANSQIEYVNEGFITGEKKIFSVLDNVTLEHLKWNYFFVDIKPENHEGLNYQIKETRKCIRENKI